jgi:hypothetical protein
MIDEPGRNKMTAAENFSSVVPNASFGRFLVPNSTRRNKLQRALPPDKEISRGFLHTP